MSTCLGGRCEACAPPQRWAISSSASANCPLCNREREGILSPGVSPKSSRCACLARGRVPHHFGWVLTGVTAPSLAPRVQGWGSRGPKSALAGDTQGAGTPGWGQGGISPPSRSQGAPLPSCPPAPPAPPPAHAFARGLEAGSGGVGILAGASLNLASVECHLTQTVCASLSPYQPFCSSHLRGGGRERLWEEEISPLPSLPAASLSFPAAPGMPEPGL